MTKVMKDQEAAVLEYEDTEGFNRQQTISFNIRDIDLHQKLDSQVNVNREKYTLLS